MAGLDFDGVDPWELERVLFEVVYPEWGGRWRVEDELEIEVGLMGRMMVVVAIFLAAEWLECDR
jgi:hypothetical protein